MGCRSGHTRKRKRPPAPLLYLILIVHHDGLVGDADWENWCMLNRRSIDTLVVDEDIKTRSLEDVRDFLSEESKQWYKDNSLPYRRGYLFVSSITVYTSYRH